MNASQPVIPVILFAYARPRHLARLLDCLRREKVPLIYAFADGAKGPADASEVAEVRAALRGVDWCEVRLTERPANLGLGKNILQGVTEVAGQHEAFVVFEDDLVCAPGTFAWMTSALRNYQNDTRVYSVTGWSHPRIRPASAGGRPYFDARAESWSWGGYARAWQGMPGQTALEKLVAMQARGIDPETCGRDLPAMARKEAIHNLWAVRWLYHHLLNGGLCLRPGESMVDHAGFDGDATNAKEAEGWSNDTLPGRVEIPAAWPDPVENPDCRRLWREAAAAEPGGRWRRLLQRVKRRLG